jgi:hypothetical protein
VHPQRERLRVVLIKNKAWGTQVSRRLIADGCHGVTRYQQRQDHAGCTGKPLLVGFPHPYRSENRFGPPLWLRH